MTRPKLILGSASPRRAELLGQLGVAYDDVRPADIDETVQKGELPLAYCRRVAMGKAMATTICPDEILLCADTTVVLGRRILGKPENEAQALEYLKALSGRRHRVITAVVLRRDAQVWTRDVTTTIKLKRLSDQECQDYLASDEWRGKAGGYAIQGRAGAFVSWLQGSYSGVVGLPLAETYSLLSAAGYPVAKGWS